MVAISGSLGNIELDSIFQFAKSQEENALNQQILLISFALVFINNLIVDFLNVFSAVKFPQIQCIQQQKNL